MNLITHNGITLTNLAYDCVVDAFRKNKGHKFCSIKKILNSLKNDITLNESITFFYLTKIF